MGLGLSLECPSDFTRHLSHRITLRRYEQELRILATSKCKSTVDLRCAIMLNYDFFDSMYRHDLCGDLPLYKAETQHSCLLHKHVDQGLLDWNLLGCY